LSDYEIKKKPEEIFREHGGQLKMSDALHHGITRYTLYLLKEKGVIEQISRGLYRLADLPPLSYQDFVTVSMRIPKGVICLVSALAYHGLTTQVPHFVSIALPRNTNIPSINYPPIQAHRFSSLAYDAGIEFHEIDGVVVKVYSIEKTIVDCFKYRNKIGMDIVLEAIKRYRVQKKFNVNEVFKYAKICRVDRAMKPYLEAVI